MITFGVIDVGVKFIVTTQAPVPTTTIASSKSMSGLFKVVLLLLPVEFPKGISHIPYGNITYSLRE